ncbi:MAG: L-histidine N(alpha)-methyltransferase [Gammaproteobacteria bacterium]|nr:L-histidine N(alpha)-methyltransferase [Rhodocyclaceae bacterium]MBU3908688.1 L-histidine N(alpha)-methyltransferase [Gammaproteobacteria bacterium]MBU3990762.1 L-histidine N(alpha)-methyltransferase [Gammaproteobacteria bacterium]MBU4004716.1 L-histidine N(alpha)-methyltransferase [Gammaproteobacteria bacterium]MBU4021319.1 L-histidine N(alpha)-methyltransferase [Gammaproteobacteria bacterium]
MSAVETVLNAGSTGRIIAALLEPHARISPKYFYDVRGSALFEDITRLPEYYLTRTERAVMATHGADIARKVGAGRTAIELGAGSCEKARALCELIEPARFIAVDISAEFLHEGVAGLRAAFPALDVRAVAADLTQEIVLPDIPRAQRLVFYPGSSIGNFAPPDALNLLVRVRHLLDDDGALLIGVDLVKDVAVLEAAYNDAANVTAAFNRNILSHINQLIGSDFDLRQWQHRAFFNAAESRIEMHLEAAADTLVRWPGGERRFARGERIHTEHSHKYRREDFVALLARAGFPQAEVWTDERQWFAVILARPAQLPDLKEPR